MAVMYRQPKSKATKIAFKVLGVPANIKHKPTEREKYINHKLIYSETARVR